MVRPHTLFLSPQDADCAWTLFDARGRVLGRLAAEIAYRLRGKHRPDFTPSTCMGDHIVVINADELCVTGNKATDKIYYRHSGYPGGIKSRTYDEAMQRSSEKVLRAAVKGMLPRNRLGRVMLRKLRIYPGSEHPHLAQQPQPVKSSVGS